MSLMNQGDGCIQLGCGVDRFRSRPNLLPGRVVQAGHDEAPWILGEEISIPCQQLRDVLGLDQVITALGEPADEFLLRRSEMDHQCTQRLQVAVDPSALLV